jgi:CheY-like chemotaxis protein
MAAKILIVEDNPDNMALMEYLLRASGHEPRLALGGVEGVRLASEERPDLVLLDIQMPDMDGHEVIAALRQRAELDEVPVVAVTAFAMVGDRDRIVSSGFDGYISKPITPDKFVEQIEEFLPTELWAGEAERTGRG